MIKIKDDVKDMSMLELCHNQVFIKDRQAWYRDYDREISIEDLARELLDPDYSSEAIYMDDESLSEYLSYVDEAGDNQELAVSLMYRAMWSMAEVREALKEAYQEIDKLKQEIKDLSEINIAKPVRWNRTWEGAECPSCTNPLVFHHGDGYYSEDYSIDRCNECGQRITWTESEVE